VYCRRADDEARAEEPSTFGGNDDETIRNLLTSSLPPKVVLVIRQAEREGASAGTLSGAAETWHLTLEGRADAPRFERDG
jgi:hypothetical protein